MTELELTVVVPVYNEIEVLDELVQRCEAAAAQAVERWELIVVDDCSTDGTSERLKQLSKRPGVSHLRLPANRGQFRATCSGLRAAQGQSVVVLDGDLQDPPELIPELLAQLPEASAVEVAVFAVKRTRRDSLLFRAGRWCYGALSSFAAWRLPPGAGSYCVMSRRVAHRIPQVSVQTANLAPFVAAASERVFAVPYAKEARVGGDSRVGWSGLIAEALSTLQFNGSLERISWAWAAGLAVSQIWGGALIWAGLALGLRRRRLAVERRLRQ